MMRYLTVSRSSESRERASLARTSGEPIRIFLIIEVSARHHLDVPCRSADQDPWAYLDLDRIFSFCNSRKPVIFMC